MQIDKNAKYMTILYQFFLDESLKLRKDVLLLYLLKLQKVQPKEFRF
jgi:hypothetical protein